MQRLDSTMTVNLESLDMGSWYSPDGREHPLTANTPVSQQTTEAPAATAPEAETSQVSWGWPDWLTPKTPDHIGARLVVGIIAIGLIFIAAIRLTRS